VEGFLLTGRLPATLPGSGTSAARRRAAEAGARSLLVRIVGWRTRRAPLRLGPVPEDVPGIVRARAGGMLTGLFPAEEAAILWARLPEGVRVVTPLTFEALVAEIPPSRAWDLANLLLDALGAPPLADDTPELEGLSHGGRSYVLPAALRPPGPLEDVLVHELAHALHDTPRSAVGLEPARRPILAVPPRARETFAWACELYAAISREDPEGALATWEAGPGPDDARVDVRALRSTLRAAVGGAGWTAVRALVP